MNSDDLSFTAEGLPIVSLKNFFSSANIQKDQVIKAVTEACKSVGCFLIVDHGVDWSIVENCFRDMNAFFHLPTEDKMKYYSDQYVRDDRGYVPFESQNVHAFMGRAGYPNDPVEKLGFGPVDGATSTLDTSQIPANIYPDIPATLTDNIISYYRSLKKLAENLMTIFSVCLSLPEDYIYQRCDLGVHSMKVNFYPKIVGQPKPNQDRFAEHTDSTPFTILSLDQCPNSLMVRNVRGEWIYANAPPGAFFVNLGDCLARWTNDHWVATPHKVVFPAKIEDNTERLSIVFFVVMNRQAVIDCVPSCLEPNELPKYEPITVEQFILYKMKGMIESKAY